LGLRQKKGRGGAELGVRAKSEGKGRSKRNFLFLLFLELFKFIFEMGFESFSRFGSKPINTKEVMVQHESSNMYLTLLLLLFS